MLDKRAVQWITGNNTGTSSKTIWAAMMGVIDGPRKLGGNYDIPYDPGDFHRCYGLLQLIPEWRVDIEKVAEVFPAWKPMADAWEELTALYDEESHSGKCPKLYERMQKLVEESRILDGWKQTGPGSWRRE